MSQFEASSTSMEERRGVFFVLMLFLLNAKKPGMDWQNSQKETPISLKIKRYQILKIAHYMKGTMLYILELVLGRYLLSSRRR